MIDRAAMNPLRALRKLSQLFVLSCDPVPLTHLFSNSSAIYLYFFYFNVTFCQIMPEEHITNIQTLPEELNCNMQVHVHIIISFRLLYLYFILFLYFSICTYM